MAGYHLFSTGEVLSAANVNDYLMKQTTMIFASASARTTALSGVLREGMVSYRLDSHVFEVYNGTAWVASETNLTTKGDLAVYSTAPDRLAVGADGSTLVANSANASGLGWNQNFAAGKNKIINGDFGIWQRGTSFTNLANDAYFADRFSVNGDGAGATKIWSQQTFTPGTAPVVGYEGTFFARFNQTVAGTGATYNNPFRQKIEDVRTYAAQTVTVSFWGKADSARTVIPGISQIFGSGGSASVFTNGSSISLTTSWVRYTQTFSVPSINGKTIGTSSYLEIYLSVALNTVQTIDIWGVQLEAGSVATAFQTATGTLQGELAACQRYYARLGGSAMGAAYANFALGYAHSTTVFRSTIYNPVPMRTAPSVSVSGTLTTTTQGLSLSGLSGVGGTQTTTSGCFDSTGSGFTQYRPDTLVASNSTSTYIEMNSEL